MVTATQTSADSTKSGIDFLLNTSKTNTSKSTSGLDKVDNNKQTSKNEDFKEVLNSKTNSKNEDDTKKVDNVEENQTSTEVTDTEKIDELKEKLKELDKDSNSESKDKINEVLTQLLNLLAKLGVKEEDLKSDGKINSDTLKNIIDGINKDTGSNNSLNGVMEKIMELLKSDSVKDKLDTDSLKVMEKLLGNLSANIADDNTEVTKGIKSNLKNLIAEISNMQENKENQTKKVLTLEDMLNKSYSQSNSENSTENESSSTTATKETKVISKEDKFLNSLIDDNKDDSLNKINLFASRTATVQNQGVNTVRGLTINQTTFVDDLIKDVKFMNTNSLKELIVKVNPGNLGEITIKLVQEDGLMKANLKANSKETTALLSQNLVDIKKQLSEQNIKIADVNIELYQDDTTFFTEQGFGRQLSEEQQGNNNNNNVVNGKVIEGEELVATNETTNNNLDLFA